MEAEGEPTKGRGQRRACREKKESNGQKTGIYHESDIM
jgi:hypothetical protein